MADPQPPHYDGVLRAPAREHPCELVRYHAPMPVVTQYHHTKPVFLQNRLYGQILFGPEKWLCGTCHDSVHAWLYGLLGERVKPAHIGTAARLEAQRTYDWYVAELARSSMGAQQRAKGRF